MFVIVNVERHFLTRTSPIVHVTQTFGPTGPSFLLLVCVEELSFSLPVSNGIFSQGHNNKSGSDLDSSSDPVIHRRRPKLRLSLTSRSTKLLSNVKY